MFRITDGTDFFIRQFELGIECDPFLNGGHQFCFMSIHITHKDCLATTTTTRFATSPKLPLLSALAIRWLIHCVRIEEQGGNGDFRQTPTAVLSFATTGHNRLGLDYICRD